MARRRKESGVQVDLVSSPSFLFNHSYKGTSDLQLERISVYYNEASGKSSTSLLPARRRNDERSSSSLPFLPLPPHLLNSVPRPPMPLHLFTLPPRSWEVRPSSRPCRSRAWNHGLHSSGAFGELVQVSFQRPTNKRERGE